MYKEGYHLGDEPGITEHTPSRRNEGNQGGIEGIH